VSSPLITRVRIDGARDSDMKAVYKALAAIAIVPIGWTSTAAAQPNEEQKAFVENRRGCGLARRLSRSVMTITKYRIWGAAGEPAHGDRESANASVATCLLREIGHRHHQNPEGE
jgi:hypothetical protein